MNFAYLNFYSFGSILAALFCLYIAVFFLIIKEKSRVAVHLGLASVFASLFHFAYAVGFFTLEPWAVYHRWIVIPMPLLTLAQFTLVLFYFPTPKFVKLGKAVYSILLIIVVFVETYFIFLSYSTQGVFVKGNHYWDFQTYSFYMLFSMIILVFNLIMISFGIWRVILETGRDRRVVLYLLSSFCILTILPVATNILSRNGSISRIAYQQTVDLSFVFGFFLLLVVYLNVAKEKTTILSRIIGITMATFFLVIQIVAYFIINEFETTFDESQFKEAKLAIQEAEKYRNLSYMTYYDTRSGRTYLKQGEFDSAWIHESNLEANYLNLRNRLCGLGNLNGTERWKRSSEILENAPKEFYGYKEAVRYFLQTKGNQIVTDQDMISLFREIAAKLKIINNKFTFTAEKKDINAISKLLTEKDSRLSPMLDVIRSEYVSELRKNASETHLENLFRSSTLPIYEEGERIYRSRWVRGDKGQDFQIFFVSYFIVDIKSERIYEVGFDYKSYRAYVHYPSFILLLCLFVVVFVVTFGFQYFFRYALIDPMNKVEIGLREVHSGNLEYRLVPVVEDEIGFIAQSFNHMAEGLLTARNRLERYAEELELKVKERTKELEVTLDEVKTLKDQQDGDYFLMSLLLKPLGANRAAQENVKVEFFTNQKKKFKFRKYDSEIGGDISISNRIQLRDRKYTVFLNADAMGKSMQGAGGALVLGAVFEAIIERTKMTKLVQDYSPERWIKNAFMELHKVFESFDGSMLVSTVIGLIDDEAGILYHLNAEHPWTVLLRKGEAAFIENDLMFRKLGTGGMNGNIYVHTLQLEPEDIVIAGSDGKDDIHIGIDENGEKLINDDHTRFLEYVKKGKGDLGSIFEFISASGRLTDDLSLVRISYKESECFLSGVPRKQNFNTNEVVTLFHQAKETAKENNVEKAITLFEEIESLNDKIPITKKYLAYLFMKKALYREAARYAEEYIQFHPLDNEMFYVASYAFRMEGEIEKAADFGERLRLRNPKHIKNLVNLSRIYIILKKYDRAAGIAKDALEIEPANQRILGLLETLQKINRDFTFETNHKNQI
ncbi:stage II sporulation protein E [Leptospira kmetyi]|uniref:SpoIIE family protein phosphatase n=1 Tax=Leptospira kmetyi TaxID=408139 RepID=UPI000C2962C3|nr:SpoIIE family protein phosphatase [Leptospira kmetyi]PJZ41613.1 stage II sporulation protein E [Leptospira kmetyi]